MSFVHTYFEGRILELCVQVGMVANQQGGYFGKVAIIIWVKRRIDMALCFIAPFSLVALGYNPESVRS